MAEEIPKVDEDLKRKEKRIGSLGWLTESAVMPKKQKAIEGVGVASLVELKAQLYRSQEEAKQRIDKDDDAQFHRATARKSSKKTDPFLAQNSGVQQRDHRDKLELKAVNDGSVSYAALEKKAEIYSKLVRGEIPDEEEKEKYCVDFFRKGVLQGESEISDSEDRAENINGQKDDDVTSDQDGRRAGIGWTGFKGVGDQHKQLIREVNEETMEAREKTSMLKQQRQLQAQKHREKLRQAFLRKQLEKLKAQKSEEQLKAQKSEEQLKAQKSEEQDPSSNSSAPDSQVEQINGAGGEPANCSQ